MAQVTTGAELVPTLAELARITGPDGKVAGSVAELLYQVNEFIPYLYWQEANGVTSETIQQRTGLPEVYYRGINQGVPAAKSEYAAFNESMAMAQGISMIDSKLLELNASRKNFRFLESLGFIESLSEQFANSFFYGDTTSNPLQFMGMSSRYSYIQGSTKAQSSQNVIDAGGKNNRNCSMWLLNSGPRSTYGIFPKGTAAGIKRKDRGEQTVTVQQGMGQATLVGFQEIYEWDQGLALKDWRWNVRIGNIDSDNLKSQSGAANLLELMIDAMYCVPSIALPASTTGNPMTEVAMTGRSFWVCPRRVRAALHKQAIARSNNTLTLETVDGKKVLSFMGIPILNCDQLILTEANLTT